MTGWREHSSHPQAKRRGSATVSFTDLQKQFGGQSWWNDWRRETFNKQRLYKWHLREKSVT